MKNILVAVDGSNAAQKAAERALELAKALSTKITVISVAVPAPAPIHWSGTHFYYDELLERQKNQAKDLLENYKSFYEKENIQVDMIAKEGDPAEEICQVANSGEYYMIVMGSKGLTGIKRALIGSVANYVVQGCKFPVLVVK